MLVTNFLSLSRLLQSDPQTNPKSTCRCCPAVQSVVSVVVVDGKVLLVGPMWAFLNFALIQAAHA
jgi:hypothetical protein